MRQTNKEKEDYRSFNSGGNSGRLDTGFIIHTRRKSLTVDFKAISDRQRIKGKFKTINQIDHILME